VMIGKDRHVSGQECLKSVLNVFRVDYLFFSCLCFVVRDYSNRRQQNLLKWEDTLDHQVLVVDAGVNSSSTILPHILNFSITASFEPLVQ
jgi:hypothetical protein